MTKFYCGIGSRQTPPAILTLMYRWAIHLAQCGYVLRSGRAIGADTAFEHGCIAENGPKQIFTDRDARRRPDWRAHAAKFHPAWNSLPAGAQLLHARNSAIMLGMELVEPVSFVLCWTPGGIVKGGTGQALRIAQASNIPVFNLFEPERVTAELIEWLKHHG